MAEPDSLYRDAEDMVIAKLLTIYSYILLARVLMSWVNPNPLNPIVRVLYMITEPVLAPVRRVIPPIGGLDLSPLVVFIGIRILQVYLF